MNTKWPNNLSSKYIRPAGRIYLYKISVSYGDKAVKNGRICLPAVLLMLHAQPSAYAPMPDGAANQHILALWSQSLKFDCFQGRQRKLKKLCTHRERHRNSQIYKRNARYPLYADAIIRKEQLMKKKLLALAMALFLVLGASACSEQTGTQASPSQTGLSPTQTADSGEAGNSAAATLPTQDDPYTWYEALDKNSDKGYDVSSIVSVDDLGRVLRSAGSELEGKSVGIFYTHANGFHAGNIKGIFDVSKIMAEYGPDVLFHQDTPISPNNTEHYWGILPNCDRMDGTRRR